MARTAKQRAALRKAQLASARKRKGRGSGSGSKKGRIYRKGNAFVRRGKSPGGRMARGAALAGAVGFTPYGYAYIGSGIRNANRKRAMKRKRR